MKKTIRAILCAFLSVIMFASVSCGGKNVASVDSEEKPSASESDSSHLFEEYDIEIIEEDGLETYYQLREVPKGAQTSYYVRCNYFPNSGRHGDNAWSSEGFDPFTMTEWGIVSRCEPRFEGHHQPNVPAWGYTNASDPAVFSQKITAMKDFGIDCIQFETYWYKDRRESRQGITDEDGLYFGEELTFGFLGAENNTDIDFNIMWVNETTGGGSQDSNTPEEFERFCDYCIDHYMADPQNPNKLRSNYSKRNGKPVFSIYYPKLFVAMFKNESGQTDIRLAKAAVKNFDQKVKDRFGVGVCLTSMSNRIELGLSDDAVYTRMSLGLSLTDDDGTVYTRDNWNQYTQAKYLGFEFAEVYTNETNVGKDITSEYKMLREDDNGRIISAIDVLDANFKKDPDTKKSLVEEKWSLWTSAGISYLPGWYSGFDTTPRVGNANKWDVEKGYPHGSIIVDYTPEVMQKAYLECRNLLDKYGESWVTVGSWNEWGEGGFLEPDTYYGYGKLRAIKSVFGGR